MPSEHAKLSPSSVEDRTPRLVDHPYVTPGPRTAEQVHYGLAWAFGTASAHRCISCDGAAAHWAYQHTGGDDEIIDRKGTRYSEDFNHYAPMCRSCHRSFDLREDPAMIYMTRQWSAKGKERLAELVKDPEWVAYRSNNMGLVNAARRECDECGMVSSPGALGYHQKTSGHIGWGEVEG